MRYIYSLILYLIVPFIPFYLKKRSTKNPAYNNNWSERFGLRLKNPTNKPIIWIHAVSVGEIRAAAKLIELLEAKYPDYKILVTQMTPTGRETAKKLYTKAIIHYIPYDLPNAVNNFYKTFKPKIGLIMETEIWPNLIHYAYKHKIPIFLVNARLSAKSYNGYNKVKFLIKPIINKFNAILCQDTITEVNFIKLGFTNTIKITGSTKFDLQIDNKQLSLADTLKEQINNKKVIIFASTREGEDELIINELNNQNYFVIIVPRHLERFKLVEQLLINKKINYIKRSDNKPITDQTRVFIGDSMGEMFMYYRMSHIAVMGGSFNDFGSQNLIEPIFLDKPVILGPSIYNFAKIAKDAINDNCAIQVNNIKECFALINQLVMDETKYNTLQANCRLFSKKYQGASQKIVDVISNYI